eukprot:GEMP01010832.1.p1 GENE.GEMP01010832.1~~GEMP01010832.1.p1  ORF type:complete len:847 (+),score=248.68 GEMP01010832.1:10-2550(+)
MDLYNRRSFLHFDVPAAERSPRARRRATSDCDACESDRDLIAQARWDDFSSRTPSTSTHTPRTPTHAKNACKDSSTHQIQSPRCEMAAQSGEAAASHDTVRRQSSFTSRQPPHRPKNLGDCSSRQRSNGNPVVMRRVRRNLPYPLPVSWIPSKTARAYPLPVRWNRVPWRLPLEAMGPANAPHGIPTLALGQHGVEARTPATGSTSPRAEKDVSEQQHKEDRWGKMDREEEKKEEQKEEKEGKEEEEKEAPQKEEEPARKTRKKRKPKKIKSSSNGQTRTNSTSLREECGKGGASQNHEARVESNATNHEEQATTPTNSRLKEEGVSAREKDAEVETSGVKNKEQGNDIASRNSRVMDDGPWKDAIPNDRRVNEDDITLEASGVPDNVRGNNITPNDGSATDTKHRKDVLKDSRVNEKEDITLETSGLKEKSVMDKMHSKDAVSKDRRVNEKDITLEASGVKDKEQEEDITPKDRSVKEKGIALKASGVMDRERGKCTALKDSNVPEEKQTKTVAPDTRTVKEQDTALELSCVKDKPHETNVAPEDRSVKDVAQSKDVLFEDRSMKEQSLSGSVTHDERDVPPDSTGAKDEDDDVAPGARHAQHEDIAVNDRSMRGENVSGDSRSTDDSDKDLHFHAEPKGGNLKDEDDVQDATQTKKEEAVRERDEKKVSQYSLASEKRSWYHHIPSPHRWKDTRVHYYPRQRVPTTASSLRAMDPLPLKNTDQTCLIEDAHTPLSDTRTLYTVPTPSISRCGDVSILTKKVSFYDGQKSNSLYTPIAATNGGPTMGVDIGRERVRFPRRDRKPRRIQQRSFYPVRDSIRFYDSASFGSSKRGSLVSSSAASAWW